MKFFKSALDFRAWLTRHHRSASELWVGFYKKDSGRGGLTYDEAVDEALCFGWIDGVRKRVDAVSYTNRFTPRRRRSSWSAVNIRRVAELTSAGRMHPSGLEVFENRDTARSGAYSYEREHARFTPPLLERFRSNAAAWQFFEAQPPSYRRTVTWWIMSAKKDDTRWRRLTMLVRACARGRRLDLLAPRRLESPSSSRRRPM